jgi:ABC-2 type transport system ATP-binding protein
MAEPAIVCRALGRRFERVVAVEAMDLEVPAGHCYALLGPNGAGKTTTVRMLCALISPSSGSARVAGCEVGKDDEVLRGRIGILTEVPGLYERLSAVENLEFFARVHGLDSRESRARIDALLRELDLHDRRNDRVANYSKGMKQKLAVIRAMLHDPEVLFLDEPSSGLDPEAAFDLRQRILDLKRRGKTILLTTHRLDEAQQLADSVGIFKGRLLASGTVSELRRRVARSELVVRLGRAFDVCVLSGIAGVKSVVSADHELTFTLEDLDATTPHVVSALVNAGAEIRAVLPLEASLEEAYLALIQSEEKP